MRISGVSYESLVDGPGLRVVLFVQGCRHGCPGCHNPDSHDENGGREYTVPQVIRMLKKPGPGRKLARGLTFSGGEPFLQAGDLATIAFEAKRIGWDVTTYTGFVFEDLAGHADADVQALLGLTDFLIDGPYEQDKKDLNLKFRGSYNQRVIDMNATRRQGGKVKLYYGA